MIDYFIGLDSSKVYIVKDILAKNGVNVHPDEFIKIYTMVDDSIIDMIINEEIDPKDETVPNDEKVLVMSKEGMMSYGLYLDIMLDKYREIGNSYTEYIEYDKLFHESEKEIIKEKYCKLENHIVKLNDGSDDGCDECVVCYEPSTFKTNNGSFICTSCLNRLLSTTGEDPITAEPIISINRTKHATDADIELIKEHL